MHVPQDSMWWGILKIFRKTRPRPRGTQCETSGQPVRAPALLPPREHATAVRSSVWAGSGETGARRRECHLVPRQVSRQAVTADLDWRSPPLEAPAPALQALARVQSYNCHLGSWHLQLLRIRTIAKDLFEKLRPCLVLKIFVKNFTFFVTSIL